MQYYIIAGEASGDLHGSNLIRELKQLDADAHIRCWGGNLMQEAGGDLVKHYRDLAFMGFVEVIKNLRTILQNLAFCKEDIAQFRPDAVILIDYPGFNLRIAEWAKKQGLKVIYYISPQVWAWKESRVHAIRRNVDKMLVILPFEQAFYNRWNYDVEYVGHPLVQVIEDFKAHDVNAAPLSPKPIVALLPGSRKQEILKKLPIMLQVSPHFPAYQFIVAKAPGVEEEFYRSILSSFPNVSAVHNETYRLLNQARAALVTSGTATLETALFGVPEIVCYKGSPVSYLIARQVIKVKYIALVNLIMDKPVVKELIQHELTPHNLAEELNILLTDETRKSAIKNDYRELKALLSAGGDASRQAAASIVHFLISDGHDRDINVA